MAMRKLSPVRSYPAQLVGWNIHFDNTGFSANSTQCALKNVNMPFILSPGGMADIIEHPGGVDLVSSFHGVLHLLSEADFATLDGIELTYDRTAVNARLYDGTIVPCWAYKTKTGKTGLSVFSIL